MADMGLIKVVPSRLGADHDSQLLREISERAKTPFTYVEEL